MSKADLFQLATQHRRFVQMLEDGFVPAPGPSPSFQANQKRSEKQDPTTLARIPLQLLCCHAKAPGRNCVGWIRFAKSCHDVHLKVRWSRWGKCHLIQFGKFLERSSCHYRCRELCACLSTTWTLHRIAPSFLVIRRGVLEYWGTWSPVGKLVFPQGEMGDRGNKRLVYPIDPFFLEVKTEYCNWWVIVSSQKLRCVVVCLSAAILALILWSGCKANSATRSCVCLWHYWTRK